MKKIFILQHLNIDQLMITLIFEDNHSLFVAYNRYFYSFASAGLTSSSASLDFAKVGLVSAIAMKKLAIFRPIYIVKIVLKNVLDT